MNPLVNGMKEEEEGGRCVASSVRVVKRAG